MPPPSFFSLFFSNGGSTRRPRFFSFPFERGQHLLPPFLFISLRTGQHLLPPCLFFLFRTGTAHAVPNSFHSEWGQHLLPPFLFFSFRTGGQRESHTLPPHLFKTKRKDTRAALAAPVRKEKKRHRGSKCCLRLKRNEKTRGQQVLPPFEKK